jgi:hypothetical protein
MLMSLAASLALWFTQLRPASTVDVVKNPPVSHRAPASSMPPDIVKAAAGEPAYTYCWYSARWYFTYGMEVLDSPNSGERSVRITIRSVSLHLGLDSTFYLPADPSPSLEAHEDGHRKIGEAFYAEAEIVAAALARPLVGQTFNAAGPTVRAAEQAAVDKAGHQWLAAYLVEVRDRSQRAHEIYDGITRHGRDRSIREDDAVRAALQQEHDEHARRQSPATRP